MNYVNPNLVLIPAHAIKDLTPELRACIRSTGAERKPVAFVTSTRRELVIADLGTDIYKAGRLVSENRAVLAANDDQLIFRDTDLAVRHVPLDGAVSEDPHWLVSTGKVVGRWAAAAADNITEAREYLLVDDHHLDLGPSAFATV